MMMVSKHDASSVRFPDSGGGGGGGGGGWVRAVLLGIYSTFV